MTLLRDWPTKGHSNNGQKKQLLPFELGFRLRRQWSLMAAYLWLYCTLSSCGRSFYGMEFLPAVASSHCRHNRPHLFYNSSIVCRSCHSILILVVMLLLFQYHILKCSIEMDPKSPARFLWFGANTICVVFRKNGTCNCQI